MATYKDFLAVNNVKSFKISNSSSVKPWARTGIASPNAADTFSKIGASTRASLSPDFANLAIRCKRLSTLSRSAKQSSVLMISISRTGSTEPATCVMLGSSKQRITWAMASTWRM